jgi:integrase
MIVPTDLREVVGLREIRYSLRTRFHREASARSQKMAKFVHQLFDDLRAMRGGRRAMAIELTRGQIRELLRGYLKEVLEEDERDRVLAPKPMKDVELDDYLESLSFIISDRKRQLALNDYGNIRQWVDDLLEKHSLEVGPVSASYKTLCREMLKVQIRGLGIIERRSLGDYSGPVSPMRVVTLPSQQLPEPLQEEEEVRFSEVVKDYIAETKPTGRWKPKTEEQYRAAFDHFIEIMGDLPLNSIDHKLVREYKRILLKLPANRKRSPKYRDKSIQELLNMDIEKPMSISNVNRYLKRASHALNYAVRNGLMSRNPVSDMMIPESKEKKRVPFEAEDLKKIFHSKDYLEDSHNESFKFWLPILALFTGCRLDELAQLHLDDIRKENRIWLLDINDEQEKNVKTEDSKRLVPIHPFLLNELNLVGYVQSLRDTGEKRLFPELEQLRDGYGQKAGQWFSRYKVSHCGITDERKTFHSFRHTFCDTLAQSTDVEERAIIQLAGHANNHITFGRYTKGLRPKALHDAVCKLNHDVELQHLTRSRYVCFTPEKP